jgi:two-component system, OmpR family, sensor histidine kinase ChvG
VCWASVIAAALLTVLAAATIVRPLTRLRRQASALAERRGILPGAFPGTSRKDELGALARALEELKRRVNDHIRLLESFAADVSHEFKNPLASIRTAAEMMADSESAADRQRFLTLMSRDVERLERLVSSLRDLARIDAQLEHESTEVVDLHALLEELIDGVRLTAPPNAVITLHGTTETCAVRASRERLVQVFENLLANALSFSLEHSTVTVRVSADARTCRVIVQDDGPGIPEAHLERVFERFFTYRPFEGRREHVGLGLAIARQIVEGYGGKIAAAAFSCVTCDAAAGAYERGIHVGC